VKTVTATGPLLVLAAAVVGVVVGERAGSGPATLPLVLGLVVGALALVVRLRDGSSPGATGRLVVGLALGCVATANLTGAFTCRALDGQVHSPLAPLVRARASGRVELTLTGDPSRTAYNARVLARVTGVRVGGRRTAPGGGRTVAVDASGAAATRLAVARAGDRVRLVGSFRPLDPYERQWRWRHAVGAFDATDLTRYRGPGSPLVVVADAIRDAVVRGHRAMPEPQRSLVAGFLLGGTGTLAPDVVTAFRAAGLSHLLVVSGENVAFVLALVGPVLRRLPMAGRVVVGSAVLVVFAAMTRFEPSVLRASAMAAVSLVAAATGRPTTGLRALALAVTALVVVDPFLVHSVGFELSVAASAGIALLSQPIARWLPGPRWLAQASGVTLGAQVAVAPILVGVFGSVPLGAVPANLLAAPFVGPLTVSGLVSGVVGGVVPAPVVGAVAGLPAWACATAVLGIARFVGSRPVLLGPGALAGALVALVMLVVVAKLMAHARRTVARSAGIRPS